MLYKQQLHQCHQFHTPQTFWTGGFHPVQKKHPDTLWITLLWIAWNYLTISETKTAICSSPALTIRIHEPQGPLLNHWHLRKGPFWSWKPGLPPEFLLLLRIRKHQVPPTAQWRIHKDSSDGMHSRLRWKQSGGVGKHSYLSPPKPQVDPRKFHSWLAEIPNNHLGWFWNLANKDKKMYHIIWWRICFMNSGQLKAWAFVCCLLVRSVLHT